MASSGFHPAQRSVFIIGAQFENRHEGERNTCVFGEKLIFSISEKGM